MHQSDTPRVTALRVRDIVPGHGAKYHFSAKDGELLMQEKGVLVAGEKITLIPWSNITGVSLEPPSAPSEIEDKDPRKEGAGTRPPTRRIRKKSKSSRSGQRST